MKLLAARPARVDIPTLTLRPQLALSKHHVSEESSPVRQVSEEEVNSSIRLSRDHKGQSSARWARLRLLASKAVTMKTPISVARASLFLESAELFWEVYKNPGKCNLQFFTPAATSSSVRKRTQTRSAAGMSAPSRGQKRSGRGARPGATLPRGQPKGSTEMGQSPNAAQRLRGCHEGIRSYENQISTVLQVSAVPQGLMRTKNPKKPHA